MNSKPIKFLCGVAVVVIGATSSRSLWINTQIAAPSAKDDARLKRLAFTTLKETNEPLYTGRDGERLPDWKKNELALDAAIRSADTPDEIVARTLPFVKESAYVARAVEILELSGSAKAIAPLEHIVNRCQAGNIRDVSKEKVVVVLAKLKSRTVSNAKKAETFLQMVGFSISDVAALSKNVNIPSRNAWVIGSPGDLIVDAFVDVLSDARRNGENVEQYASVLKLNSSQSVQYRAASLSLEKEIETILDYGANGKVVDVDKYRLVMEKLPRRGKRVANVLAQKFEFIEHNKVKLNYIGYYDLWFDLARKLGDRSLIEPLKALEKAGNANMRMTARMTRNSVERTRSAS